MCSGGRRISSAVFCSRDPLFNEGKQMKRIPLFTVLGFSLFAVTSAFAADGYVTGDVNLRAGPDSSYPSVAMLSAGTPVAIQGCVDDWSWCDVAAGDNRGWVAGNFLQEEYQGQRVLVPEYGVQIGIPIVSFAFGSYWDDHYRNRSWYGERERWSRITPQYRAVAGNGGSRGNSHNAPRSDSHSSYAPHNGSHGEVRQTQAAAHSSSQVEPAHRPAPQHAGVARARTQATAQPARPPRTSVAKTAARGTPHPQAIAQHKTVTAHKPAPKAEPRKEGDKDKDQH
jgi:uncharacterized protein YraI